MTEKEITELIEDTERKWREVKADKFVKYTVKELANDILTACKELKDHIQDNGLQL